MQISVHSAVRGVVNTLFPKHLHGGFQLTAKNGIRLYFKCTSNACPLQYDVFHDEQYCGYVYYRAECLTVESADGKLLLGASGPELEGWNDEVFSGIAAEVIAAWIAECAPKQKQVIADNGTEFQFLRVSDYMDHHYFAYNAAGEKCGIVEFEGKRMEVRDASGEKVIFALEYHRLDEESTVKDILELAADALEDALTEQ